MKIEIRPKDNAMVVGETINHKGDMIWHVVAFDESDNEVDIILTRKQALSLEKEFDRRDLHPKRG